MAQCNAVRVNEQDMGDLLTELRHLRLQRDELQKRDTQLITELRARRKEQPCTACLLLSLVSRVRPPSNPRTVETIIGVNEDAGEVRHASVEHTCDT